MKDSKNGMIEEAPLSNLESKLFNLLNKIKDNGGVGIEDDIHTLIDYECEIIFNQKFDYYYPKLFSPYHSANFWLGYYIHNSMLKLSSLRKNTVLEETLHAVIGIIYGTMDLKRSGKDELSNEDIKYYEIDTREIHPNLLIDSNNMKTNNERSRE